MIALPSRLFESPVPGLRRPLTASEGTSLVNYLNILIKWQLTQRLVGSVKPEWLVENVVLHSFAFLEAIPAGARNVADLGSGGGIPGIPIAIARPDISMTLIEARQRRVSFLATVTRELRLERASVVGSRAESLGVEHVGRFDVVLMRCAGEIGSMLPAATRLTKKGGFVVASAGPSAAPPALGDRIHVASLSGKGSRAFDRFLVR